eukprot:IDg3624t1
MGSKSSSCSQQVHCNTQKANLGPGFDLGPTGKTDPDRVLPLLWNRPHFPSLYYRLKVPDDDHSLELDRANSELAGESWNTYLNHQTRLKFGKRVAVETHKTDNPSYTDASSLQLVIPSRNTFSGFPLARGSSNSTKKFDPLFFFPLDASLRDASRSTLLEMSHQPATLDTGVSSNFLSLSALPRS